MTVVRPTPWWTALVNGPWGAGWFPARFRARLLRALGADVHPRARFRPGTYIYSPALTVGAGTFVNARVIVQNGARVTLGRDVSVGPGCQLLTVGHDIGPSAHRAGTDRPAPVGIGDGCWLGAGVIVLPGVTMAPGCVIAAGAVVTADTEPDGLYVGVPARRVRDL